MEPTRHLDWQGCWNARDLGGLPVRGGGTTRWAAAIRSDELDGLTASGWDALSQYGVRTIIDLRNDEEFGPDTFGRPAGIETIHLPLDANHDREFWDVWETGPQFGTPLYYRPHLERFPERTARVLATIADASPGAVLFHCGGGRDRAGQITMVLLALVGVPPGDIAADYMLSHERLPARYAARGEEDQGPSLRAFLAEQRTTGGEVIEDVLHSMDVHEVVRAGGLTDAQLIRLRQRLLVTT